MTRAPDEHVLAVDEEKLSPVIVLATIILVALFLIAVLYRIGLTVF